MKFLTIICTFFTFINNINAQDGKPSNECSQIIITLSNNWKKDSLAINEFRYKTYETLLNCKRDSVSMEFLIAYFGKPNEIQKINNTIWYMYYVYDAAKRKENPYQTCLYIYFSFSNNGKLLEIKEGFHSE
jgi:hypothetical protein